MEENVDKHVEKLTKKVMSTSVIESPSFDFKSNVMAEIKSAHLSNATKYTPLISSRVWVLIGIALVSLLLFILFGDVTVTAGWLSQIGIERFYNYEIANPLSDLNVPTTLLYAVIFFGIMLTIQIPLLKRYFNQRLHA